MDVIVFYADRHKPYHNSPPLFGFETDSKHQKQGLWSLQVKFLKETILAY
jgi:hypothetical protein